MSTDILAVGDEITVWPLISRGESRDTEAGAQPWKATYLGTTKDGHILVQDLAKKYGPRVINPRSLHS